MNELLQHAGTFEILMSAMLATACVAAQSLLARWWVTPAGRHTWVFQAVFALCLDLWALRLIIPEGDWFLVARLAAFSGVPVVLAWRLAVIVRTWRAGRRKRAQSGDGA